MGKVKQTFVCRSCGALQSRWMGKCPDCGEWDALEEQTTDLTPDPHATPVGWSVEPKGPSNPTLTLAEIDADAPQAPRRSTNIREFDRVLGGGLVAGSAILVGGDPGIGKSTLLLQVAGGLVAPASDDAKVLYVSSEESAHQVRVRAERLGINESPDLFVLAETNLAKIIEQARRIRPGVLVIDSIQMIHKADLTASPGSVGQLRRCAGDLVSLAKSTGMSVIVVGHVTKDGQIAGPRLLEHLVDTVLYFEGDRYQSHRVVRAVKNRFGTTLEIGLFEMTGAGLQEVPEGGSAAAIEGLDDARPGSVICPVMTGSRCVLVELQALTATGFLGAAKRKSSGVEPNRLAMLIAVLEQHAELRLADRDIFASSVGGIRVIEPAADLALLLAIAGAQYKRSTPTRCAAVGEVGLGGEVRPVPQLQARINEARRLGIEHLIIPASSKVDAMGVELIKIGNIADAIAKLM